jgi:hypothetical protein
MTLAEAPSQKQADRRWRVLIKDLVSLFMAFSQFIVNERSIIK